MRVAAWGLAASSVVIASCGGGGGGDGGSGDALYVTLSYANASANLFEQVALQPQLGGFEGHAAHCSLVNGSLPAGLSLGGDCVISGRATQDGNAYFTLRVGASGAGNTIDVPATLRVQGPMVQYPDRSFLQALALGAAVSDAPSVMNWTQPIDLQASWSYRLTGGALPTGLSLDPVTGRISGTAQAGGAFTATVQASLATQFGTFTPVVSTYMVNVNVPFVGYTGGASDPLHSGAQTVYISQPATLTPVLIGASAPGTTVSNVSVQGTLPPGLMLDAATGIISGTPGAPGQGATTYDVQATLTNGGASASTQGRLELVVSPPVISTYASGVTLPVNQPASLAPTVTALSAVPLSGAATVSYQPDAGSCTLPPGMAVDAASGAIAGTPTATGSFQCTVDVTVTDHGVTWTSASSAAFLVQ